MGNNIRRKRSKEVTGLSRLRVLLDTLSPGPPLLSTCYTSPLCLFRNRRLLARLSKFRTFKGLYSQLSLRGNTNNSNNGGERGRHYNTIWSTYSQTEIASNRSDIVFKNTRDKKCTLVNVAIPWNKNTCNGRPKRSNLQWQLWILERRRTINARRYFTDRSLE